MNIGFDISLRLQQKMSFNMIQSLKLLQVNAMQLEQMLRAELEQNPLLETDETMAADAEIDAAERMENESGEGDGAAQDDKTDDYLEELTGSGDDDGAIDWEEYLEDGFDPVGSYREEADRSEDRYESTAVYEETLEERLTEQLSGKKLGKRAKQLVQFLISSLDDDGYLRVGINSGAPPDERPEFAPDDDDGYDERQEDDASDDDGDADAAEREIREHRRTVVQELAKRAGAAECEIEDALSVLQRLDPPGVGARDLQECLMLQLRAQNMEGALAMKIVSKYWALFEKLRIPAIAKRSRAERREVQEAIAAISRLDPKPGHRYGANKAAAIIPDLVVSKIDGRFVVTLNDGSIPSLYINKRYADMIKRGSKAKSEVKEYVRAKFNSATMFIRAIEQRNVTIIMVMNAIVERQKAFFEYGPPSLVPLRQQEIADDINRRYAEEKQRIMRQGKKKPDAGKRRAKENPRPGKEKTDPDEHEHISVSTVSRVVNDKYVQTPHGIFELRYFFNESIGERRGAKQPRGTARGGADGAGNAPDVGIDVPAERVKSKIRQLIDGENRARPLSDQKIADVLSKEGLPIARRTVAKYREQMRIPTTRMRQSYA